MQAQIGEFQELDSLYLQNTKDAFEKHFPRSHDIWLLDTLESIFHPLAKGVAEIAYTYDAHKVCLLHDEHPSKSWQFPFIKYSSPIEYETLALFVQTFDKELSIYENLSKLGVQQEESYKAIAKYNQSRSFSWSTWETVEKPLTLVSRCIDNYPDFVKNYAHFIPDDPEGRAQFQASLLMQIGTHILLDFPLSEHAKSLTAMKAFGCNQIPKLKNHMVNNRYVIPNWGNDPTLNIDLLYTTQVLISIAMHFHRYAGSMAKIIPLFIKNETFRGTDTPLQVALLATMAEGILSILQALSIGHGQIISADSTKDEDKVIEDLIQSRVPTQLARYLPIGYLGPAVSSARYIEHLLFQEGTKYMMNGTDIKRGKEIKKNSRGRRRNRLDFQSYKDYLGRGELIHQPLSTSGGNICPISRDLTGFTISDIDLLSYAFLHIFQIVRSLRNNGYIA